MKIGIALVTSLAIGLGAPTGFNDRKVDIEIKEADVVEVYKILSQVAEKEFQLDPCVKGTVDLNLKHAPVSLVMEALATKLHLAYDDDGSVIHVLCPTTSAPAPIAKVTLSENGAALHDVLNRLAATNHLAGVDYNAKAEPTVTMTLPPVRLTTALTALSDASGVAISVQKNRLVASD